MAAERQTEAARTTPVRGATHVAAGRYEFQLIEFLRTAQRLNQLAAAVAADPGDIAALVTAAEEVISVENQGWMAKLAEEPPGHTVPEARPSGA